jgi:ankyrin repeat protein
VNFTTVDDDAAETALTLAAKYNATEAFEALLAAGADASREANYVALCYGADSNNMHTVHTMLAAGAPVDYEADASLVPLARAVMQRHTQMVQYLIEQGADVNKAFPVCCGDKQNASVALE